MLTSFEMYWMGGVEMRRIRNQRAERVMFGDDFCVCSGPGPSLLDLYFSGCPDF